MAKKEQNIMLLQEVVGQLRKLNATSVRDRLREAEEAKRAEAIAMQGEVQEDNQGTIISDAQDFQRRFIAGQAKTFTDKTLQEGKSKEHTQLLIYERLSQLSLAFTHDLEQIRKTLIIGLDDEKRKELLDKQYSLSQDILDFHKKKAKYDIFVDREAASAAEEARREGIGRGNAEGSKATRFKKGWNKKNTADDTESGGSWWKDGAIAAMALKTWSWTKGIAAGFLAYGKKIFSKFKLTGKQTKALANPRKWPWILAAVVAGSFLSLSVFGDEGEESDGDVMPPDLDALPEESNLSKNMDTIFTAAAVGGILSRRKIVKKVATSVGAKVTKAYKSAPKNSMRGRMFANAGFKRGLALTGRGLLRFMGPWGMAAWIAWELGSFALKRFNDQEAEGQGALEDMINDQLKTSESVYENPELASLLTDPSGPMKFGSAGKKNEAKAKIRKLMEGKSKEVQEKLKKELMELGWQEFELMSIIAKANLPEGSLDRFSNLNKDKKNKLGIVSGAVEKALNSKLDSDNLLSNLEKEEAETSTVLLGSGSHFAKGPRTEIGTIDSSSTVITHNSFYETGSQSTRSGHHLQKGPR